MNKFISMGDLANESPQETKEVIYTPPNFNEEMKEEFYEDDEDFSEYELDVELDDDDIFDINLFDGVNSEDEVVLDGINSLNVDGIIEKVVFNENKDRFYLTLDIKNTFNDIDTYFKITFFDEDATEYKDQFEEGEYKSFYNLVLTISINHKFKNDKSKYPRLIFNKSNGSYC